MFSFGSDPTADAHFVTAPIREKPTFRGVLYYDSEGSLRLVTASVESNSIFGGVSSRKNFYICKAPFCEWPFFLLFYSD
jgi:hypothetical protein